jgi:hypothetical protein
MDEMGVSIQEYISDKEILSTLSSFQKRKNPGPDELTIEFFLGFYDLLKSDLLKVALESQRSSKILGSFNSTYLSLIPKNNSSNSLEEFLPISCCNLIYKTITKIISRHLNPILSNCIFEEKYGFLNKRQIHNEYLSLRKHYTPSRPMRFHPWS